MKDGFSNATLWASFFAFMAGCIIQAQLASGQHVLVLLAGAVGLKYYFYAIALPNIIRADGDKFTPGCWFLLVFQVACIIASHVSVAAAGIGSVATPLIIIGVTTVFGVVYIVIARGRAEKIGTDQLVIDIIAVLFILLTILQKIGFLPEDELYSNEGIMLMIGVGYVITVGLFAIKLLGSVPKNESVSGG